jgi:hypothetical protein
MDVWRFLVRPYALHTGAVSRFADSDSHDAARTRKLKGASDAVRVFKG